jgi:hypothetical protein
VKPSLKISWGAEDLNIEGNRGNLEQRFFLLLVIKTDY